MKICPKCGKENSNNSKYCEKCGKALDGRNPSKRENKRLMIMIIIAVILSAILIIGIVYLLIGGTGTNGR